MALSKEMKQIQTTTNLWEHGPLRLGLTVIASLVALMFFRWSFDVMQDKEAPKMLIGSVALFVGVFGVWALFWLADDIVSAIPSEKIKMFVRPYVFVGPAILLLMTFLIYPAINTIYISFFDARSANFIGLENYIYLLSDPKMLTAFQNNISWLFFATSGSVLLGLLIAVLVDKVRYEAVAKSFIFIPMAISLVGASVIWRFVYAYSPPGRPQIGLLNAIVTTMGGEPIGFLIERGLNNFALIIIMVWLQTGFAMVILSAAIKGVPGDLIDAAKIDGANAWQIFLHVVVPYIKGAIITVTTTIAIAVLKVFDIVFVMTSGQYDTEVIANRMFAEMFRYRHFGRGSALAVILLLAVIPIIVVNVRNLRQQRS